MNRFIIDQTEFFDGLPQWEEQKESRPQKEKAADRRRNLLVPEKL